MENTQAVNLKEDQRSEVLKRSYLYAEELFYAQTSKSYYRYEGAEILHTVYVDKGLFQADEVPSSLLFKFSGSSYGKKWHKLLLQKETDHKCVYYGYLHGPIKIVYVDRHQFQGKVGTLPFKVLYVAVKL